MSSRGCKHRCRDKKRCQHRCCKIIDNVDDQVEAPVDDSLESLRRRAKEAEDAGDIKLALELYGQCVHLHVDEESFNKISLNKIFNMSSNFEYNEQEKQMMQQRIDDGDVAAMFLVAQMTYRGLGEYSQDLERAFSLFSKASSLGHVYSTYMFGFCLQFGHGVRRDPVEARRLYLLAADGGSRHACLHASIMLEHGSGGPKDLFLAALYYRRGAYEHGAARLTQDYALEVAPWSRWTPTPEIHQLVPPQVHQGMLTWTLISKRLCIPKYLDMMVTRYITTRDGWLKLDHLKMLVYWWTNL